MSRSTLTSRQPEDLILGKPNYFASAHPFPTGGVPLLVKADSFRPIKVDGNPDHPYNLGSSDVFTQGSLLDLYDPDRSQHALLRGNAAEWPEFLPGLPRAADGQQGQWRRGDLFPEHFVYFADAAAAVELRRRRLIPRRNWCSMIRRWRERPLRRARIRSTTLERADVIVSLDADFLSGATIRVRTS
jgi:hypothetical protein